MEEKNELNDILLQSENDSSGKSNILLIIAAVLIIFFLGVVGYKIVSDTSGGSKALPTKVSTGAKSEGFSKMTVNQTNGMAPTAKDPIEEQREKELDAKLQEIKKKYQQDTKTVETKPTLPVEEKIPAVTTKPAPKKLTPIKKEKVQKPVQKTAAKKAKTRSNYYVQLGSYFKKPSKKFLSNITKNGFKYKIHYTKSKKDNKYHYRLYVGPYKSKGKAKSELQQVKKKLKVDRAFVIKDY